MDITNRSIEEYMLQVAPERDPVLTEMERLGEEKHFPIVGPLVGRFLYQLVLIKRPDRVLELGSGYGYSAYWIAKALPRRSKLLCTDNSEENSEIAQSYLKRGGLMRKVDFWVGNSLEIIDQLRGKFDMIVCDVEKHQYPQAFRKAVPRLKKGGIFVADNVLWSGRVMDAKPDRSTAGILTFTRLVFSSPRLYSVIIPLKDGLTVSVKR
jgi:predicted O-methyltransferase YrrM